MGAFKKGLLNSAANDNWAGERTPCLISFDRRVLGDWAQFVATRGLRHRVEGCSGSCALGSAPLPKLILVKSLPVWPDASGIRPLAEMSRSSSKWNYSEEWAPEPLLECPCLLLLRRYWSSSEVAAPPFSSAAALAADLASDWRTGMLSRLYASSCTIPPFDNDDSLNEHILLSFNIIQENIFSL